MFHKNQPKTIYKYIYIYIYFMPIPFFEWYVGEKAFQRQFQNTNVWLNY